MSDLETQAAEANRNEWKQTCLDKDVEIAKLRDENARLKNTLEEAECTALQGFRSERNAAVNQLDLMVDEFKRIKALDFNSEVNALCDRAITRTCQSVPIIEQRDNLWDDNQKLSAELDSLRANAIQILKPPFTPENLLQGTKVVMEAYEPGQWKIGIIEHFGQRWVGFYSGGKIEQIAVDEITRIICLPDFGKDGG